MAVRYDVVTIKAKKTDEGFILDSPIIGRAGILHYRNADGTDRAEYRPPNEAFDADSLESIRGKPITLGHPGLANSSNAKNFPIIGSVLSPGRQDGNNIRADVSIYQLPTTDRQLSCGYKTVTVETPGVTPEGEHYDAIQTHIRYNHLGVVAHGRAGVARLNMDGDEVEEYMEQYDDDLTAEQRKKLPDSAFGLPEKKAYPMPDKEHAANAKARASQEFKKGNLSKDEFDRINKLADSILGKTKGKGDSMETVKLDGGLSYEVPPEVAVAIAKMRADAAENDKKVQALQGKFDALTTASEKAAKEAKDAAEKVKTDFADAVKCRIKILGVAKKAGIEKADEMDDKAIKTAVIKKVNGDSFDLEGKSDDYLNAAYDMCEAIQIKNDSASNNQHINGTDPNAQHEDGSDDGIVDYMAKVDEIRKAEAEAYLGKENK